MLITTDWVHNILILRDLDTSNMLSSLSQLTQFQEGYMNGLTSCATSYLPFMAATMSELRPSESRQSTATRLTSGFRYCGSRSSSWASFCTTNHRQSPAFSFLRRTLSPCGWHGCYGGTGHAEEKLCFLEPWRRCCVNAL